MSACPRCHQSVEPRTIACPHCRTLLKAHGHPGIPLYRATGLEPLCLTCTYHADNTCTFPKRPEAIDCTLYDDISQQRLTVAPVYTNSDRLSIWVKRNVGLLAFLGLVLLSLLLVLVR